MTELPRIDTLICDKDGTLVDSGPLVYSALEAALVTHGVALPDPEIIRAWIPHRPQVFFEKFAQGENPMQLKATFDDFTRSNYRELTFLYSGVEEELEGLRSVGVGLAIWTSRSVCARQILEHHGILGFFKVFADASHPKGVKPHPDTLAAIMRDMEADPAHTAIIGDSHKEVQIARDHNLAASVSVLTGYPELCVSHGPLTKNHFRVPSFVEGGELVRRSRQFATISGGA